MSEYSIGMLTSNNVTGHDFIDCVNGEGDVTTHSVLFNVTLDDSKLIHKELTKMFKNYTMRKNKKSSSTISISNYDSDDDDTISPSSSPPLSLSSKHRKPPPNSDVIIVAPPCRHEGVPRFMPAFASKDAIDAIKECQPSGRLFYTNENRAVHKKKVHFYYSVEDPPDIEAPCDIEYSMPPDTDSKKFPAASIGTTSTLFFKTK